MKATGFSALLVDLDGVIRHWPADDTDLELKSGLPAGALRKAAFEPVLLHKAISGEIPDEAWRGEVVRQLQRRHPDSDAKAAVATWSAGLAIVDKSVLEILRQARKTLKIVLVTNATSRLPADLKGHGLATEFDFVVNSSAVGAPKPDERFYRAALAMAAAVPSGALFVDDAVSNVEAAQRLGLRAHRFKHALGLSQFLRSNGILG